MIKYTALLVALFLFVTDISFAQQWLSATAMGSSGNDALIASTNDRAGNVYLLGTFNGLAHFGTITLSGNSYTNVFLAKYTSTGSAIWARVIATAETPDVGSIVANALTVDAEGGVFITGNYAGIAQIGDVPYTSSAPTEIFLTKLDVEGITIWTRTAGGTGVGTFNPNTAYGVAVDSAGNSVIVGRYYRHAAFGNVEVSSSLAAEMFIASYDRDGSVRWAQTGRGDFGIHTPFAIAIDRMGNAYVTGAFFGHFGLGADTMDAVDAEQKIFLCKVSTDGQVRWATKVGAGGYYGCGNTITLDNDGNPVIAGYFRATLDLGDQHFTHNTATITYSALAVKYSRDSALLWGLDAEGDQTSNINAIVADASGLYAAGSFTGNPRLSTVVLPTSATPNSFVVHASNDGQWQWARSASASTPNVAYGIASDPNGAVAVSGIFQDSVRFGPVSLIATGASDVYLARLDLGSSDVTEHAGHSDRVIFPNPADRSIHIDANGSSADLYDMLGHRFIRTVDQSVADVSSLPNGVYTLSGQMILIRH
jgi:hypothetical protein